MSVTGLRRIQLQFPVFICFFFSPSSVPTASVCRSCKVPDVMFTFFFWLGYCNSCVNPIIYAAKHPQFKKVMRHLLRCRYSEIEEPSDTLKALVACYKKRFEL